MKGSDRMFVKETTGINPQGIQDTLGNIDLDNDGYLIFKTDFDGSAVVSLYVKGNGSIECNNEVFQTNNSWKRYAFKFNAIKGNVVTIKFTQGNYYIYEVMLENGTLATDWTESPEELQDKIDSNSNKYSELKVQVDGISQRVQSDESTLSQVSQTANKINWLVQNGTSASNMELTSDFLRIASENIDLSGKVTFSDFDSTMQGELERTITSIIYEYAQNESADTPPDDSEFDTDMPTWENGKYMWQRTKTTYLGSSTVYTSTPTNITGSKGADGTSVTILGSYDSEEALKQAHPTGNVGDSYLVQGYLYVWDIGISDWKNVGQIKGDKGDTGSAGIYIKSVKTMFYLSTSSETPTGGSWVEKCPTYIKGRYYFTYYIYTYSDGSTADSSVMYSDLNISIAQYNDLDEALDELTTIEDGKTVIDGGKIKTNSILSKCIVVDQAFVNAICANSLDVQYGKIGGFTILDNNLVCNNDTTTLDTRPKIQIEKSYSKENSDYTDLSQIWLGGFTTRTESHLKAGATTGTAYTSEVSYNHNEIDCEYTNNKTGSTATRILLLGVGLDNTNDTNPVIATRGDFTSLITTKSHKYSNVVIGANNKVNLSIDVSASITSGYKLLCAYCRGTGLNAVYSYYCAKTGDTTVGLDLKNTSSSSVTISPEIQLVLVKSEFF